MDEKLKKIIALGFALRFVIYLLAVSNNAFYEPDSDGYSVMGKAFAKGDFLFQVEDEAKRSSLFRPAGYPIFLGIFYAIGLDDKIIVFGQLLLDLLNIYLIFLIAQKFDYENKKIGYLAALLYAISPLFISFFFKILTETLFTTVLLGALYYFFSDKKNHSAVLFGILVLIKPVAIAFPIFFAIYEYIKTKKKGVAISFLVISMLIASFWLVRNYAVFNKITYSAISTVNYVCWNGVYLANDVGLDNPQWKDFIADKKLASFDECQNRTTKIFEERGYDQYFNEMDKDASDMTRFVLANPVLYLKQYLKGAITFFIPTMPNNLLEAFGLQNQTISLTYIYLQRGFDIGFLFDYMLKNSAYAVILIISSIYELVLYALFVLGMKKLHKEKNYALLGLVVVFILYNIIAIGPVANYRFRIPPEPLIILIAAYSGFTYAKPSSQQPNYSRNAAIKR